jgi:hypothetical protein
MGPAGNFASNIAKSPAILLGCMMSQVVKTMLRDIFFLYRLFFRFELFCHLTEATSTW